MDDRNVQDGINGEESIVDIQLGFMKCQFKYFAPR